MKRATNANLGASYPNGATFDVEWVLIETPDNLLSTLPANFVWAEGQALGAATFARLEGCWYGNDKRIYIVSTSGGIAQGQIWEYDPKAETIALLFQSPSAAVLNMPDNITVSPRGGLVLCEDGSGEEFLHGLTVDGQIFPFAKNNVILNGERNGIVGNFTGRVGRRLLQPGRRLAVRQHPEPGHHVRHHGAVAGGGPVVPRSMFRVPGSWSRFVFSVPVRGFKVRGSRLRVRTPNPGTRTSNRNPEPGTRNPLPWRCAVENHLHALECDETFLHHAVQMRKERRDLVLGVDDLDDDREVRRESQDLGRVEPAVRAEADEPLPHRCASESLLPRLFDNRLVQRSTVPAVGLADEDPQQLAFSW